MRLTCSFCIEGSIPENKSIFPTTSYLYYRPESEPGVFNLFIIYNTKVMGNSDDIMSGKNQEKGNAIALVISVILLAVIILGYVIFG